MRLDGARILDHQLPYVNSVLSFLARGHRPLGAKVRDRERERKIESHILDHQLPPRTKFSLSSPEGTGHSLLR